MLSIKTNKFNNIGQSHSYRREIDNTQNSQGSTKPGLSPLTPRKSSTQLGTTEKRGAERELIHWSLVQILVITCSKRIGLHHAVVFHLSFFSIRVNQYIILMVYTSIYGGFSMTILKPLIMLYLLGERILHVQGRNKENNFIYFSALIMFKNKRKMFFRELFFPLVFLLNL